MPICGWKCIADWLRNLAIIQYMKYRPSCYVQRQAYCNRNFANTQAILCQSHGLATERQALQPEAVFCETIYGRFQLKSQLNYGQNQLVYSALCLSNCVQITNATAADC